MQKVSSSLSSPLCRYRALMGLLAKATGIGKFTCSNYSLLRDSDLDGVDCQERSVMRPIGLDNFLFRSSQFANGGCSSAGRALDLHSRGRRFDPDQLHQFSP
jgi:hypothetical protein